MRAASVIAALSFAVAAASAHAFTITPSFTDGDTQSWTPTEEAVVSEAISDWTSQLTFAPSTQNIVLNFDFTHAGTSSYLAQWSGNSTSVPRGTSLYPWSASITDTININADLMVPRDSSTGPGYNVTLLFTQGDITGANWDGLSAVRHEIGHALGFSTLYIDFAGKSADSNKYQDYVSINGNTAVFDQFDGGLNVPLASSMNFVHTADPSDLMSLSLLNGVRKNISITDLQMLSLAYGYTLTVPAGVTYTTSSVDVGALNVNGSLVVSPTQLGRQTDSILLYATDLTLGSGGLFDLANHDLDIHSGLSLADVKAAINSARNTGNWDGTTGITSSAAMTNKATTLGYAMAGDVNISIFDQVSVNPTDILVKYTYYGDSNLDGAVDLRDLQTLANHWQSTSATWSTGDFNGDGVVDIRDLQYIANNWQIGATSDSLLLMPDFASFVASPEPAAILLLTSVTPALLLRRRAQRR